MFLVGLPFEGSNNCGESKSIHFSIVGEGVFLEDDLDYKKTNILLYSSLGFISGENYAWQIVANEGTRSTYSDSSFTFCEPIVPVIVSTSCLFRL